LAVQPLVALMLDVAVPWVVLPGAVLSAFLLINVSQRGATAGTHWSVSLWYNRRGGLLDLRENR